MTNILINGDFVHGLKGWRIECAPPKSHAGLDLAPEWKLDGVPTAFVGARRSEAQGRMVRPFRLAAAVGAGKIIFSGFFAAHRCQGNLELKFFDTDGRTLAREQREIRLSPRMKGGQKSAYYSRETWEIPVPSDCASGELAVILGPGLEADGKSRYLFFHSLSLDTAVDAIHSLPSPLGGAIGGYDKATVVDTVVAVHNALEDVQKCLQSLAWYGDGLLGTVFVVNDGSNDETSAWLRQFCATHVSFKLIEHERSLGFSRSMNDGLKLSKSDFAVVLNSDTIVTRGWLESMVACMESDRAIGIAGPLSNAASWQNVPELLGPEKKFAVNELPEGMTPNMMATLVRRSSSKSYPRVRFLNGFCFMVRREVFDAIGFLDARSFPRGYGEENDFCIRAAEAGFALAVADDAYVFHAKSKSFGHETRRELSDQGMATLKRKHTAEKVDQLIREQRKGTALAACRDRVRSAFESYTAKRASADIKSIRPLFVLPCRGGGGGAHSIVQEVAAMREMGVKAAVAVRQRDHAEFLELYANVSGVEDIFRPFEGKQIPETVIQDSNVAIGTIFTSMKFVKTIVDRDHSVLPAYYIQDYEPWFVAPGTAMHEEALESYTLIPDVVCFAKTQWLCHLVQEYHGIEVGKVVPSLDHSVYKPGVKPDDGRIHICAMVRPSTPRRAPEATMEVLAGLHSELGDRVAIHIFGCARDQHAFLLLQRDFPYTHHGILKRHEVAQLLGRCHLFIDMSDYQAFGRTAVEAIACGCMVAVPAHGGATEYMNQTRLCISLDTQDISASTEQLTGFIKSSLTPNIGGWERDIITSQLTPSKAAQSILTHLKAASCCF